MKKIKVYLDTSVIGGIFDTEFKEYSQRLIQEIRQDRKIGVISEISIRELEEAPEQVKAHFKEYIEILDILEITSEVRNLAKVYLDDQVVTQNFLEDALHIACATVNQIDVLVSWNFRHIVNYNKILLYNAVNLKEGYKPLNIYTPREVLEDDEE